MHPAVCANHHHLRLRGSRFTLNRPLRAVFVEYPPHHANDRYKKQIFHSGSQRIGDSAFESISANADFHALTRRAKQFSTGTIKYKNIIDFNKLTANGGAIYSV
jgi:hypothetical protein